METCQAKIFLVHPDPAKIKIIACFVALRPKSTAMVMAGRSVHLTTLFPEQLTSTSCTYFRL